MKKRYISLLFAAACLSLNSCIGDLDTLPLNESDFTSEDAYSTPESYLSGLSKIYYNFANTEDLAVEDGGASEVIRAFWTLQEISSDGCKCAWANDSWVNDINNNNWSDADNAATYAVYARTLHGITYVNEFLRQSTDSRLSDRGIGGADVEKIHSYRSEARFLRAYLYWMAMDIFGDVPFVTEDSPFGAYSPAQKPRKEVFEYIESELLDLTKAEAKMPAARSNYPRADIGAVWGLLARLYLNAEVYTGTARWADAKKACEEVFALGYDLCPNYADLFRGDNGQNPEARQELMFTIDYEAFKTQSYGGTSYLAFASIAATDKYTTLLGINNGWGGIRVPYEYARDYFNVSDPDYENGTYKCNDKRGQLFYIKGRKETMENIDDFNSGWSLFKYNNIPHDKTGAEYESEAQQCAYSNIDFPCIRLGEIYLIYAEAVLNMGSGNDATAVGYLNDLRQRAGLGTIDNFNQDYLIAERARELMWEGHRRTDLIRWNKFTSGSFVWRYKGGSYDGQTFPDYKKIFAIPSSELAANTKLVQNPGY